MEVTKREEVIPFVLMVMMEGCTIGLTILAKTAFTGGMSPFVFAVYTNALASLLLFLSSFVFHNHRRFDQFINTPGLLLRIFYLGFTGVFMFQNLAFVGLTYSSPIMVCAMGLLIPSFSFLLAVLLRRTSLEWGTSSTKARVIGSLMSFCGAMVEEFYKGPYIRPSSSSSPSGLLPRLFVYYKFPNNWVLGGLFLAASAFSISIWNIIQLGTVTKYPHPQVMQLVSLYSLVGTVQCTVFSLFMERDLSAWMLKPDMNLLLIIITGIFGSVVRTYFHMKFTETKGPFYVPLFKPFGIFWATLFGTGFFVNSLHYGSVLGAAIAGVGYYTVMWGNMRHDDVKKNKFLTTETMESCAERKTPLLLREEDDQV